MQPMLWKAFDGIDPPTTITVYDLRLDTSVRIANARTGGKGSHVTPPEPQKTVARGSDHVMHGRLVEGTHVTMRLLALHIRLYIALLLHNLLIITII